MPKRHTALLALSALSAVTVGVATAKAAGKPSPVIEVVTLKIRPGAGVESFRAADKEVERQHVARQPGFISRESAAGKDGAWVVIVHWRSVKDAQASMDSFEKAPAAARFMSLVEPGSMQMNRYGG